LRVAARKDGRGEAAAYGFESLRLRQPASRWRASQDFRRPWARRRALRVA